MRQGMRNEYCLNRCSLYYETVIRVGFITSVSETWVIIVLYVGCLVMSIDYMPYFLEVNTES